MTKNEYIASIMLEATELLRDDVDSLNEVYNDKYFDQILNEAVEFSDISLLLEVSDEIKEIQSDIKNTDIDNDVNGFIKKIKSISDKLLKWYYKVEPNKKLSGLRTLIKTVNGIIYQILSKIFLGGIINRLANAKTKPIRYLGIALVVVLTVLSGAILKGITYLQTKLYASNQYKYNIKDFDDNIKLLRDGYNKLKDKYDSSDDKKLKSGLQKTMDDYKKSINELVKLKNKYDKLKDSKISARGAAIRLNENKKSKEDTKAYIQEAIDLLYDKAIECDTIYEAAEYIDKAEELEYLLD